MSKNAGGVKNNLRSRCAPELYDVLIEKISNRHKSGHCILKKGGSFENMIKDLKSSDKLMRGCICIVQPGISKGLPMPDKIQEVLAATDKHVKRAGKVTAFRILGSC